VSYWLSFRRHIAAFTLGRTNASARFRRSADKGFGHARWLLLTAFLGCSTPALFSTPARNATRQARDNTAWFQLPEGASSTVVILTLDGVRWQEMFAGAHPTKEAPAPRNEWTAANLLPHLYAALSRQGAALGAPKHGVGFHVENPQKLSLPGYNELFLGTGEHGCGDNDCARTPDPTVVDRIARGASPDQVAAITSWAPIERAVTHEPGAFFISAGRQTRHGAVALPPNLEALHEQGCLASAPPGANDYRPDSYTAEFALAYLEWFRPKFLFVGLGDTDEYAHQGNYAAYLTALGQADEWLGKLLEVIERMNDEGYPATLLVTTDHGRARAFENHGPGDPESGRTFLFAFGHGIRARGLVRRARSHSLSEVAGFVERLLGADRNVPESATASIIAPSLFETLNAWDSERL
jgi:hypothetical protein